jgi:hypothetical protein
MRTAERKTATGIGVAVVVGVAAAGIAYLLYMRPQWRRHAMNIGRHVWWAMEGLVKKEN